MTAGPESAGSVPLRTVDPAAAVARTRPRTTITETISQTLIMAWRALKKMRRNPEQFFDVTLQPLLFTAMFAFIFGGAISGNVHSYLPLLIPGIVAQTVLTTSLTFLSNAFVPVTTLPGWLQAFVKVNPVSHLVSAARGLANQGVVTSEAGWTVLAGLVVIAVFAPLERLPHLGWLNLGGLRGRSGPRRGAIGTG